MQSDCFSSILMFYMLKKSKLPIVEETFWEWFIQKEFEEIQVVVIYQRWTHECPVTYLKFKYLRYIFFIAFCLSQFL